MDTAILKSSHQSLKHTSLDNFHFVRMSKQHSVTLCEITFLIKNDLFAHTFYNCFVKFTFRSSTDLNSRMWLVFMSWSSVRATGTHFPPTFRPIIARQSPQLAVVIVSHPELLSIWETRYFLSTKISWSWDLLRPADRIEAYIGFFETSVGNSGNHQRGKQPYKHQIIHPFDSRFSTRCISDKI